MSSDLIGGEITSTPDEARAMASHGGADAEKKTSLVVVKYSKLNLILIHYCIIYFLD